LKNLEKLNIANNKITALDGFPATLIELDCNTNEIVKLDFDGLTNLKKINISNNKINIVENLGEGVEDFNMDGNPSITFQNSVVPNMDDFEETDTDKERLNDYSKYLHKYFQLKKKYEDAIYEAKLLIFQKYSKKEAKKRIAAMNPKCLKCKRPGGTIFKYEDYTHYAVCGVEGSPCELNIEIQTGQIASIDEMYALYKDDTQVLKDSIIRHKLDALFNYVSEDASIDIFKKELTSYNDTSSIFKDYLNQYNEIYNNDHKKERLQKLEFEFKEKIQKFKSLLQEYRETNNKELLSLATEYQMTELNSLEKQIRDLKYVLTEMEYSKPMNILIQKEYFTGNIDEGSKTGQRVIKYNV
jgi:Leucine-rich repeat (LRR) protein